MVAVFFFSCVVVLAFIAYGYRSRAHSAEAKANKLQGALEAAWRAYEGMREIAREAIRATAKEAGLNPNKVLPRRDEYTLMDDEQARLLSLRHRHPFPIVAYCPACNVSVRHSPEAYPVKCPREGCDTLIDPTFDDDLIS